MGDPHQAPGARALGSIDRESARRLLGQEELGETVEIEVTESHPQRRVSDVHADRGAQSSFAVSAADMDGARSRRRGEEVARVTLRLPGFHNVLSSLMVLAVALLPRATAEGSESS